MRLEQFLYRRLPALLAGCLILAAVNVALYVTAVSRLDRFSRSTKDKVEKNRTRLQEMEKKSKEVSSAVKAISADRQVVGDLASKVLMTREQRLVGAQRALQELIGSNGLSMESVGYSYAPVPPGDGSGWGRRYTKVTMQIPLTGVYPHIKGLIWDLQQSPEFFVVEALALSSSGAQGGTDIRVNLTVSTLFASGDGAPAPRQGGGKA